MGRITAPLVPFMSPTMRARYLASNFGGGKRWHRLPRVPVAFMSCRKVEIEQLSLQVSGGLAGCLAKCPVASTVAITPLESFRR
jgi:hypothetical protein